MNGHADRCAVNIDRECGLCNCGYDAHLTEERQRKEMETTIADLQREVTRLKETHEGTHGSHAADLAEMRAQTQRAEAAEAACATMRAALEGVAVIEIGCDGPNDKHGTGLFKSCDLCDGDDRDPVFHKPGCALAVTTGQPLLMAIREARKMLKLREIRKVADTESVPWCWGHPAVCALEAALHDCPVDDTEE